jgi:hypothetical protein
MYIFTGSNSQNGNLFQKLYMRFEDLSKRIEAGNYKVALDDWATLNAGYAPYSLWDSDGTPVHLDLEDWKAIGLGVGRGDHDDRSFDKILPDDWVKNSFVWYCSPSFFLRSRSLADTLLISNRTRSSVSCQLRFGLVRSCTLLG